MSEKETGALPKRYEQLKRMTEAGTEYNDLPGEHITLNRLVAYNMAYFRKAAGLKQDELAERLNAIPGGPTWSNATVSAAERSWDGKRVRQFDADLMLGLAGVFGLPMAAFFLPPEDDGVEKRYLIEVPYPLGGNQCLTMRDLLNYAIFPGGFAYEADDEEEANDPHFKVTKIVSDRYRERLETAMSFYRDPGSESTYGDSVWGVTELSDEEVDRNLIMEKIARTRHHYEALRQIMGDINKAQEDLYERLGEKVKEKVSPSKLAEILQRFRSGEDVEDIAVAMRLDPWLVEKALMKEGEGILRYSEEVKSWIFVRNGDYQIVTRLVDEESGVILQSEPYGDSSELRELKPPKRDTE